MSLGKTLLTDWAGSQPPRRLTTGTTGRIRQFREDMGEKVIGINLAFSGSWELVEFQTARK
jgi:hypothetical protein